MTKLVLALVMLAVLPLTTFAQRIAFSTDDLTELGATDVVPVDDDGNPDTLAWLLTMAYTSSATTERRQLVVLRASGYCFEAPFDVGGTTKGSAITIVREGRRDMLKVAPSTVRTIVVRPDGTWMFAVPTYAPIELQRLICR